MNKHEKLIKIKLHPTQIMVVGFALVILIGTVLLSLPISIQNTEVNQSFFQTVIDAFFTSTSAVCVTGLVVVDTGSHWTIFGQIIIGLLIQIGGLGFMTFGTLFAFVIRKKISFRERLVMQEALNQFKLSGIVRIARNILIMTFTLEGIGAIILSTRFIPKYGPAKGIGFSIFHSVSAFCNAGFDLFGQYGKFQSLTSYVHDPLINLVVMVLIITGGLGFTVIMEIFQKRRFKKFSLHAKLVLRMTALLIIIGALGILLLEYSNKASLGNMSFIDKILPSLFQGITPRTAGFNTLDFTTLTTGSVFLIMILMFIGGSPGSTAGGAKTTTIGVAIAMIFSVIKGKEDTELYGKKVPLDIIKKAISIILLALGLIATVTLLLSITEVGVSFKDILFESISAFGTVGLSLGITPNLTNIGRVIIALTMFFGRVGPLTVFLALAYRQGNKKKLIRYPEERVIVG
ncbi:TrkH family potassium uptake protein [Mycoplasmatota bacterium]|nr:TrkH family potassium uptake protein [Mycoplasmatota bacterium]